MITQIKCGILCIHLFNILNIAVSHYLPNVTNYGLNEEQFNKCEDWQFQCENGQCNAKQFLCDVVKDCIDVSDETYVQCRNKSLTKCDELHFQCKYGPCIEKKYQCDGLKQCVDGSDESPDMCNLLSNEPDEVRIRRDANESCALPESSVDKTIKLACEPSQTCPISNGYVPKLATMTITCATGYYQEDLNVSSEHICHNKRWLPPIAKCLKKCDQLNPVNVILQCRRNDVLVNTCDGNSVLLAGTKVHPLCKPTHKYDSHPSYLEITCDKDGKWDNTLLPCVPECGKPYIPAQLTIAGGNPETTGGSPWHVAIFDKNKLLICGGTIISEHLVISAAHCFSEGKNCEGTDCVNDFDVVIGKYTNNYTTIDNVHQKTMKIKEIRFPKKGFLGLKNYYAADIAILILTDPIPISPAILPACLHWIDLKNRKFPAEGELGKVVGWGRTENHTLSPILKNITLPFISHRRCVDIVDPSFIQFITFDKFCAGTGNKTGATLLDGDSGGGILFEDKGLFYLRGVVSVKQYSSNAANIFTDLSEHIDWIAEVHDIVEKESQKNKTHPNEDVDFTRIYLGGQRRSPAEIVEDIKSLRFSEAEKKLLQANDNTYYYIVHEVYNHQAGNFDLLFNFGDSIVDAERKFKIYNFLYNATAVDGFIDPRKLLRLRQSVKKEVLDRSSTGALTKQAETLYEALMNAIQEAVVEPISSAFQNDNSWSMVKKLIADIRNKCTECTAKIYNLVVETVWNKINVDDLLNRAQPNLIHLNDHIALHLAVINKIEREGGLYSNVAISLARHIKHIMDDSNYENVSSDERFRYQEAKNKLPASAKNIVFSTAICIKNTKYNEYLYPGGHPLFVYDNDRRHVFTWIPGGKDEITKFKWYVTFSNLHQVRLLNDHFKEYLYAAVNTYDTGRRYAFTWRPGGSIIQGMWDLEVDGDHIYMMNSIHREYLFADHDLKKYEDRRYVFTYRHGGRTPDSKWQIEDCSSIA